MYGAGYSCSVPKVSELVTVKTVTFGAFVTKSRNGAPIISLWLLVGPSICPLVRTRERLNVLSLNLILRSFTKFYRYSVYLVNTGK